MSETITVCSEISVLILVRIFRSIK